MRCYYFLCGVAVACVSAAITWWNLVDPQAFVSFTLHSEPSLLSSNRENVSNTTPADFVSYMFNLQWPPSTCTSQPPRGLNSCLGEIPRRFTIHGLWPEDKNDEGIPPYAQNPSCTTKKPTDTSRLPTILLPIQRELEQQWPNLTNSRDIISNRRFWGYEWDKHGKCSEYPDQPLDYFKKALELKDGLVAAAGFFGLTPGKSYTVRQVEKAVKNGIGGKQPQIACSISKIDPTITQLYEIRICYDKGTFGIRNCLRPRSDCPGWKDNIDFPEPPQLKHCAAAIGSEYEASE